MDYLCYYHREPDLHQEIIPELKLFFQRIQQIRRSINSPGFSPHLNRIQRERCKENLFLFEKAAREFDAIENRDDFYLLHRHLQRYLRLHTRDLRTVLGMEPANRVTLFIHYA